MNSNQNQPREFDVVLGGNNAPPITGAVLGGIEGVKRRLESENEEARIAALRDALNYEDEGLDLVIQALKDFQYEIPKNIISMLRKSGNKGKKALLNYNPWLVLTTFRDWKDKHWFDSHNIDSPTYGGYYVSNKNNLIKLINHSEVKKIKS